jgi:hypothetical protein
MHNQQQLNEFPIILKQRHQLNATTKLTIAEISPPHTGIEQENAAASINSVNESAAIVIEPVKYDLDPSDPQQLVENHQMVFELKGETFDSDIEPDIAAIRTQHIDSITFNDESLNALSLEKLTPIGMKSVSDNLDVFETLGTKTIDSIHQAVSELKETQYLSTKYSPPILCTLICDTQNEKATNLIIIKTEIVFQLQFYNNILKLYWFMIWPFDPGGVITCLTMVVLTFTMGGGVRIAIYIYPI